MDTVMSFLSYLFAKAPGSEFRYYIPMVILMALLIAGSIVFSTYYKKKRRTDFAFKRLFKKVAGRMVLFGLLFAFLIIVRYENIPYFSMRIWIYLSLLGFAYAVFHYTKIYLKVYPTERENAVRKMKQASSKSVPQYLPNKKRR
jgi:hypothetical protein